MKKTPAHISILELLKISLAHKDILETTLADTAVPNNLDLMLKDKGMGEYCLSQLPISPRSHGQPSTSRKKSSQPIKLFDGMFIQAGTVVDEIEDKDVLNWLYKDNEDT